MNAVTTHLENISRILKDLVIEATDKKLEDSNVLLVVMPELRELHVWLGETEPSHLCYSYAEQAVLAQEHDGTDMFYLKVDYMSLNHLELFLPGVIFGWLAGWLAPENSGS